jgi:hypothetical protein
MLAAVVLALVLPVRVEAVTMSVYLVPIETIDGARGPNYFAWPPEQPTGIICGWSMMDYGFSPIGLLVARDIDLADHANLIGNADVFYFPTNLDTPVDQDVRGFFEGVNLPTDWLGPSTTWRELLRQTAGMFQFNQRYMGIVAEQTGELHSIWDTADLDTRLREMTAQEQTWFLLTVDSFGYDSSQINDNNRLRQLVKQTGDFWIGQEFYLGGLTF